MQPFVDGYLGHFHVLAVVNCAALNIRLHVPFRITVLSGYMPRSGIAIAIVFLVFEGTSILFPIVVAPASIPMGIYF